MNKTSLSALKVLNFEILIYLWWCVRVSVRGIKVNGIKLKVWVIGIEKTKGKIFCSLMVIYKFIIKEQNIESNKQ